MLNRHGAIVVIVGVLGIAVVVWLADRRAPEISDVNPEKVERQVDVQHNNAQPKEIGRARGRMAIPSFRTIRQGPVTDKPVGK